MRRARAVVPPPSGQTTIPEQTYKTGHTNSRSLPMYQSERTRHRRLQKLTKVMQYIRNTKDITLTIEPDEEAKWWVDSSYAVHPDMKVTQGYT